MKNKEYVVAGATLLLVTFTLALSLVGQALPPVLTGKTVSNAGTVMAIGVGVYSDSAYTDVVSSIDWGMLEPGSNKDFICYVRNEGNAPCTLSMYTTGWSPQDASNYIDLNWDYAGELLNPDDVAQVTFTLSVAASIDGITSFSFDIAIVGSS